MNYLTGDGRLVLCLLSGRSSSLSSVPCHPSSVSPPCPPAPVIFQFSNFQFLNLFILYALIPSKTINISQNIHSHHFAEVAAIPRQKTTPARIRGNTYLFSLNSAPSFSPPVCASQKAMLNTAKAKAIAMIQMLLESKFSQLTIFFLNV